MWVRIPLISVVLTLSAAALRLTHILPPSSDLDFCPLHQRATLLSPSSEQDNTHDEEHDDEDALPCSTVALWKSELSELVRAGARSIRAHGRASARVEKCRHKATERAELTGLLTPSMSS